MIHFGFLLTFNGAPQNDKQRFFALRIDLKKIVYHLTQGLANDRQRQRLSKLSPGATFFARLKLVQRRDIN
jgi:hypothetical protein